jgi:Ca2+-binding EF-hand superfamily protein
MAEDAAWVLVQKKTFTKWMNSHLKKVGSEISDCQTEFDNGIKLMQLLKALYGLDIPKHNPNPKMRPQQLDNISLAFDMIQRAQVKTNFLKTHHLVDHDLKMILGMVWAIILDYQIKGISVEELSAKEALLLWCQKKTKGYRDVKVDNFTTSWRDGMALCALIHKHRPDLLDFDSLERSNHKQNLQLAFDVAEKSLGIAPLLDVDDVDVERPDERSIMTYISEFYHKFTSQDHKETAARRVQRFARFHQNIEEMEQQYVNDTQQLLQWVQQQTETLGDRTFPENYDEVKALIQAHKDYKVHTKPKYNENRLDNETLLNNIQTKLRTNKRRSWDVPSEYANEAVDQSWYSLGQAENARGKALRDHLAKLKDGMKRDFAEKAQNFNNYLDSVKQDLNQEKGESLQEQIDSISQKADEINNNNEVAELENLYKALEAAGIEDDNPYTELTFEELLLIWEQVKNAVNKRKQFLESQLAASGKTNITPEQINEFKETFKHFDKDNSGALDKLELRSCLQTLGQVYPDDQFDQVYSNVAAGSERVTFDNFVDYMIKLMEDTDDANQIKASFRILSNEQPVIQTGDLYVSPLEDSDVKYLTTRMPGDGSAFDFASYTDNCYA